MNKLTVDQLETLVQKRNKAGLQHTVEVMNNEELAAYKINCEEAIERLKRQISKAKEGGSMQQSLIENKELLEGYIVYIDTKLNEKQDQTGEEVIDTFLANWKEKAYQAYTELKVEYNAIEGTDRKDTVKKRNSFLWGLTKRAAQIITYPAFEANLKRTLDLDVREKKNRLFQTITKKAGNIINASDLKIGINGDINGIVIGDKAKVKVETITAGGFNIQKLHYRVLVKEVK